jgi:hypothetical protein
MIHAGKTVTVLAGDDSFRLVIDGETVGVVPRATTSEVHRYKANATHKSPQLNNTQPKATIPCPK